MKKIREIYKAVDKGAFWFSLIMSVLFATIAFFTPPQAVIDSSVIACIAEFWAFAALATVIAALDKGKNVTVSKGDVNLSVSHKEDDIDDKGV